MRGESADFGAAIGSWCFLNGPSKATMPGGLAESVWRIKITGPQGSPDTLSLHATPNNLFLCRHWRMFSNSAMLIAGSNSCHGTHFFDQPYTVVPPWCILYTVVPQWCFNNTWWMGSSGSVPKWSNAQQEVYAAARAQIAKAVQLQILCLSQQCLQDTKLKRIQTLMYWAH